MEWIRQGEVPLPRTPGEADSVRAWRPWVLEDEDATLRMWYTGSDGTPICQPRRTDAHEGSAATALTSTSAPGTASPATRTPTTGGAAPANSAAATG